MGNDILDVCSLGSRALYCRRVGVNMGVRRWIGTRTHDRTNTSWNCTKTRLKRCLFRCSLTWATVAKTVMSISLLCQTRKWRQHDASIGLMITQYSLSPIFGRWTPWLTPSRTRICRLAACRTHLNYAISASSSPSPSTSPIALTPHGRSTHPRQTAARPRPGPSRRVVHPLHSLRSGVDTRWTLYCVRRWACLRRGEGGYAR